MTTMRGLWTAANRAILINASSLIATTAVTAGLGFVYWLVAARAFSPSAVGLASAAISAMTLLAFVGVLGLGTLLMGELPRQGSRESSLITTALVVSGVAGGALGLLFAILAPIISTHFRPLQESIGMIALFAAGVALTSASLVIDQALIGLLLGGLQFGRNAVFAMVKLAALVLVSLWAKDRLGMTIYATWTAGNLVSLAILAVVGNAQGWLPWTARPQWSVLRGLRRTAMGHHALNLAMQFPVLALPIVVTASLSAAFNAYFYVAWMLAFSFVWVAPYALSVVMYTIGSRTPAALGRTLRFTLALSLVVGVLSNLVLPLIGDPILHLFGRTYAGHASLALRILVLAVFPLIIKDHFVSVCRIERRMASAAVLVAAGGIIELVGATLGAHLGGLPGLSLGWAAVICIEAALMGPAVYRAAARDRPRQRASWVRPAPVEAER